MNAPHLSGEVHPVAALFPMLPDDELADLVADIKANGLLHPVVLDAEGVLIDGRNRLEACRRAGVEPTYTTLNGHDPVAYILGQNINRRHLSKGQRAMAVAMARRIENIQTIRSAAEGAGVSSAHVGHAAIVLDTAPELADAVMAGASLNDAYQEALRRKRAAEDAEGWRQRAEEEERRRVEREEKQRRAVELTIEEIGPEVPIPPPAAWPDMTVGFEGGPRPNTPKPAEDDALKRQQVYLERLRAIGVRMREVRETPVVEDGWWPAGHVVAVRSAISKIVADALAVVEMNNAISEHKLRRVE